jgi:hypothetical protein
VTNFTEQLFRNQLEAIRLQLGDLSGQGLPIRRHSRVAKLRHGAGQRDQARLFAFTALKLGHWQL